jgi:hypothetical protein
MQQWPRDLDEQTLAARQRVLGDDSPHLQSMNSLAAVRRELDSRLSHSSTIVYSRLVWKLPVTSTPPTRRLVPTW